jgi:hypothetical protein
MTADIDKQLADTPLAAPSRCIFHGCVSTDRHWHYGFPGGYDNPADPDGPPILFTSEPAPGVRDYNGALLLVARLPNRNAPDFPSFGVDPSVISNIVRRKRWTHV